MPSAPFASVLEPAKQFLSRLTTIKPQEVKLTIGMDIGSAAVKVVALGPRRGGGARPIVAQHLMSLTPEQDADASEAVKSVIATLQLPTKTVNLSVSGQWVIMRIVEMPTMKPTEMRQALPFEAQRYLPFDVQDVVIDGVVLGSADANKSWVLIVACKKELIERRLDAVRRAGLDVALIDVDALALANAFVASANGRVERTRALIDVGAQLTNLVILKGLTPYLVRDISWGGDKFARHVTEHLGAEATAVNQQLRESQASPELHGAATLAAEALVTELQLSFDYFENRFGQPPEEVFVAGGVSQSAAFLAGLKSHVTQPVAAWSPVKGLSGQFAVAYGLALRTE